MALLSVAEAHSRLLDLLAPLTTETVALEDAAGRVLGADVLAGRDQPPFAASAMDGYAVRRADAGKGAALRIVGEAAAGGRYAGRLGPGQAVRIFTGAPVPEGADWIVIREDSHEQDGLLAVTAPQTGSPAIRTVGGDFARGDRVNAPRRLGPTELSLLAAMNAARVPVVRRPVVAIVPTGDELVPLGETPEATQIVSSIDIGLAALVANAGGAPRRLPIARDTTQSLAATLRLAADADLIVTIGGASAGDFDLVARTEDLVTVFHGIAMRPGKPLLAGRLGTTPLIGLPGNPASAFVCAHLFLRAAIARLLGLPGDLPPEEQGRLSAAVAANGPRAHYMRAAVTMTQDGPRIEPHSLQDSSLLSVLGAANALLVRAPGSPAAAAGDPATFIRL